MVAMVRTRLQRHLEGTIEDAASEGPDDDAWYWAAPILLDLERASHTRNGWTRKDLSLQWKALLDEDEEEDDGGWEEHVAHAKRVLGGVETDGSVARRSRRCAREARGGRPGGLCPAIPIAYRER